MPSFLEQIVFVIMLIVNVYSISAKEIQLASQTREFHPGNPLCQESDRS